MRKTKVKKYLAKDSYDVFSKIVEKISEKYFL